MSLQNVMDSIEGHQFAAEANLAAGFDAFHRGLQNHLLFRELSDLMRDDAVALKTVLVRLIELSQTPIRMQYENPFDSAMAAYLMAVEGVDPEVAAVAAEAVSKAPNCWWASQISSRIAISADLRRLGVPSAPLMKSVMHNMVVGGAIGHTCPGTLTQEQHSTGRGCYRTRKRRAGNRAA